MGWNLAKECFEDRPVYIQVRMHVPAARRARTPRAVRIPRTQSDVKKKTRFSFIIAFNPSYPPLGLKSRRSVLFFFRSLGPGLRGSSSSTWFLSLLSVFTFLKQCENDVTRAAYRRKEVFPNLIKVKYKSSLGNTSGNLLLLLTSFLAGVSLFSCVFFFTPRCFEDSTWRIFFSCMPNEVIGCTSIRCRTCIRIVKWRACFFKRLEVVFFWRITH